MNMLLCQVTSIVFVLYASLNTIAYVKLRKEIRTHKIECNTDKKL